MTQTMNRTRTLMALLMTGALNAPAFAQMRAVGAAARHQLGHAVKHQRHAGGLHGRHESLDPVDLRALVGLLEPQQHGGHVGCAKRLGQRPRKAGRILDLRRDEIEARSGAFGFGLLRLRHDVRMGPQSGGMGASTLLRTL